MKLILLICSLGGVLLASCPAWWFDGVDHGSCSVHSPSLPLTDQNYLGCFYRFIDKSWKSSTLPSANKIIQKEAQCEKGLRLLLATSPINKAEIELESLQRGFRTALCVLYLHFQELKSLKPSDDVDPELKNCPKYGKTSGGSLQNESEIVNGLASDWKSLSHQLRKTVSLQANFSACSKFWVSLAEIIESVLSTDCDVCNVCDNQCPAPLKPSSPLPQSYTQEELQQWESYVANKLDYCPQDWKNGIPKGSYEDYYEIQETLGQLDIKGTSDIAIQSRKQFVDKMIYSKFITCQIQVCACPNLNFDNSCSSQLNSAYIGVGTSLTYYWMNWDYFQRTSQKQIKLYNSFYGVEGGDLLSLLRDNYSSPEFKLSDQNLEILLDGTLSQTSYATYLTMISDVELESGFNKATRTALVSIAQKMLIQGNDPTGYLQYLGGLVSSQSYTELVKSLKSKGFQSEAQIITYSLLPRNVSLTQLNMIIYIDRASDDEKNGELVKSFLKSFTEKIHTQNSYFSLAILEIQHTVGAYDTFSPKVLLNSTNPTLGQINTAIDLVSLDPNLGQSPFSYAYQYAYEIHKTWNPTNQQVVLMMTSAGLDEDSQEFQDTYQVLNRVFMQYDNAVVGVGPKVYQHFSSLVLMGKNVKSENFPLTLLQSQGDIEECVNKMEGFLHYVTNSPRSIDVGSYVILILSQDDHVFFKVDTQMSTEGIHLKLKLPKDYTDVYASLTNEHPSKYDYDFKMELASRDQQKTHPGDDAEYILNIPIYTYEIQQTIALQNSQGFSNWKRHIYIGIHAIRADYILIGRFYVIPGTIYPLSYTSYIIILLSVIGLIVIICCVCVGILCRKNCCLQNSENQNILHSSITSNNLQVMSGQENTNLLDKFLSPDDMAASKQL